MVWMDGLSGWTNLMHGWSLASCLALHGYVAGRRMTYSGSVDAASVSVSRARDALDDLDLQRHVHVQSRDIVVCCV